MDHYGGLLLHYFLNHSYAVSWTMMNMTHRAKNDVVEIRNQWLG